MTRLRGTAASGRQRDESLWSWGLRLEHSGDTAGSLAAYSQATDAGEEPEGERALLRYAEELESRSHHAAAEAAFNRLCEAADSSIKAAAWRGIASYRLNRGEIDAGLAALQVIVETGDPEEAPRALRNIGTFQEDELGDLEAARTAYRAAIAYDHPLHSQGARVNLAQLLAHEGDHKAAAELYRAVVDSRHPMEAQRARYLLGTLYEDRGEVATALEWYESAITDEGEEWTQRAALCAGGIYLLQLGQLAHAADRFRIAERIADPGQSLLASSLRGQSDQERGDHDQACAAFTRVIDADPRSAGAARYMAAKGLGTILLQRQQFEAAHEILVIATASDDADQSARAFCLLGICERARGDREAAIAAFQRAASTPGASAEALGLARTSLMELH